VKYRNSSRAIFMKILRTTADRNGPPRSHAPLQAGKIYRNFMNAWFTLTLRLAHRTSTRGREDRVPTPSMYAMLWASCRCCCWRSRVVPPTSQNCSSEKAAISMRERGRAKPPCLWHRTRSALKCLRCRSASARKAEKALDQDFRALPTAADTYPRCRYPR
jgi:hypothetical protein